MTPAAKPDEGQEAKPFKGSLFRFFLAALLLLAGYVLLLVYSVNTYARQLIDARERELQRVVNLGLASLSVGNIEATQYLSLEQIRRNAALTLRDIAARYSLGENQLIMLTDDGVVLVFPLQPDLELSNQLDLQDADGAYLFQDMLALADASSEDSCLRFSYAVEEGEPADEHLACMHAIPEWKAVIGVMMNLKPTIQQQRTFLLRSSLLTLVLVGALVGINLILLLPTFKSYETLRGLFRDVRLRPDQKPIIPKNQFPERSEARALMEDFESMLGQIERSKRAREEAALAERSRLARELHDAVSQTLFSASLIADVIPSLMKSNHEEAVRQLEELRQLTRGAQAEMRTLLVEMRPDALMEAPLDELIQQLLDGFRGRYRIPVERSLKGRLAPPVDVKLAFYRIAQEALHNAAKHSGASRVQASLEGDESRLTMTIADDGRGFKPDAVGSGRLGLKTMRERAEAIGAALTLESRPGDGTRLNVAWSQEGNVDRA